MSKATSRRKRRSNKNKESEGVRDEVKELVLQDIERRGGICAHIRDTTKLLDALVETKKHEHPLTKLSDNGTCTGVMDGDKKRQMQNWTTRLKQKAIDHFKEYTDILESKKITAHPQTILHLHQVTEGAGDITPPQHFPLAGDLTPFEVRTLSSTPRRSTRSKNTTSDTTSVQSNLSSREEAPIDDSQTTDEEIEQAEEDPEVELPSSPELGESAAPKQPTRSTTPPPKTMSRKMPITGKRPPGYDSERCSKLFVVN